MDIILDDLDISALVAANKANLRAMLVFLGRSPCADYRQGPPLTWMLSWMPPSIMNPVFVERLRSDEIDRAIADALAYFKQKQVSVTSWWSQAGVDPTELGRHLEAHGLAFCEGMAGMVADLLAMPEDPPSPAGLAIEPVTTEDALHRYIHAAMAGFEVPAEAEPPVYEFYRGVGFDFPLRSYVGSLDGEPVASSQLFLDDGVAGVYMVATAPWARQRGIGTSMTLAAMRDARALGCHTAILQASEMGYPVYERLGFREVCRLNCWEWHDTPQ